MYCIDDIYPNQFYTFFMFPFSFKQELSLEELISILKRENGRWKYFGYGLHYGKDYNEYLFFYPHIRNILFSNGSDYSNGVNRAFFKYKIPTNKPTQYRVINDLDEKNKFDISLPLVDIYLHLFENRTGILAFEILQEKPKYSLKDYLKFLDFGRRIYPSFINPSAKINKRQISNAFTKEGKDAISAKQCASKIIISNDTDNIATDFINDFKIDQSNLKNIFLSKIIRRLLDSKSFSYENNDYWPIVDDRMYTLTYYDIEEDDEYKANYTFLDNIINFFKTHSKESKTAEVAKIWYQMIFVDSDSPACANDRMIKKLIDESTYKRWSDFGGLYGFSRYSSAFLSNYSAVPYVRDHFATMYYQIAMLLFFYRGSLLSFSERGISISESIKKRNAFSKLQKLHEDFLLFENKYWFKEVTAQDQGIELFDLWEAKMRNHYLLNDVKQGIQELYSYFDSKREKKIARRVTILAVLGGILLPLTIAVDIMSIDKNLDFHIFTLGKNYLPTIGCFIFLILTVITIFTIFYDSILNGLKNSLKFLRKLFKK